MSAVDVAVDARITTRTSTGVGRYVEELVARLPVVAPDLRITAVAPGTTNLGFSEQAALPVAIARLAPRLVHYTNIFVPLVRQRPYIVTVHDLIHLRLPELFGRHVAAYYRFVAGPMLRGAALLIVADPRTQDDCERYLGVPAERCRVVPLGYDEAAVTGDETYHGPRPYLFYAGNHRPHKDLPTLFRAWATVAERHELDCLVTGNDEARDAQRYASANGELIFLGDLPRAELAMYLRGALAYVQPSLAEGFGIPVLDAAAAGTPVIATTAAVPAVVAPFATTFAPGDASALVSLLEALVRVPDAARARAAQGVTPSRAYTWDRFAAATAAVYREVLDGRPRS